MTCSLGTPMLLDRLWRNFFTDCKLGPHGLLPRIPLYRRIYPSKHRRVWTHTIRLSDYDFDPMGCFLEFLYTGEYIPASIGTYGHTLSDCPITTSIPWAASSNSSASANTSLA